MYREIAQQKKEKAERERVNAPKDRDYEKEHEDTVKALREKEEQAGERYNIPFHSHPTLLNYSFRQRN